MFEFRLLCPVFSISPVSRRIFILYQHIRKLVNVPDIPIFPNAFQASPNRSQMVGRARSQLIEAGVGWISMNLALEAGLMKWPNWSAKRGLMSPPKKVPDTLICPINLNSPSFPADNSHGSGALTPMIRPFS